MLHLTVMKSTLDLTATIFSGCSLSQAVACEHDGSVQKVTSELYTERIQKGNLGKDSDAPTNLYQGTI